MLTNEEIHQRLAEIHELWAFDLFQSRLYDLKTSLVLLLKSFDEESDELKASLLHIVECIERMDEALSEEWFKAYQASFFRFKRY